VGHRRGRIGISERKSPHSISRTNPDAGAAAKLLTRDETRRIAANIAKLPESLTAPEPNPARAVVLGKWTGNDAPIPSPKFPVREAPLASVARGFLLPPIRNKTLNGAAAEC
jgi:hypothetical protein